MSKRPLMNPLTLCIDVGNSFTSIGIFRGDRLVSSNGFKNNDIPFLVKKLIKKGGYKLNYCLISSVVPTITQKLEKTFGCQPSLKVIKITPQVISGIRVRYKSKSKLGIDRAINALGAHSLMGGDCVVADFGTALTLDFISKEGVFEGGLILPGLETALASLHEKTALLPAISLKGPAPFPGRSTEECMRSGVLKGFGVMTEGIVRDFKARFGLKKCALIVTGGNALEMRSFLRGIRDVRFDPHFTLRSMNVLSKTIKK